METEKKKKSDFSAISINRIVAGRYREFSKKISKSHTLTLELMMDFFEGAKISPKNKYLMNQMGFEHRLNKRLDYLEELLRNWEKNSSIPKIHDMLKKVFDFAEQEEKNSRKDLELQQKMYDQSLKRDKVTQYDNYMLKKKWKSERKQVLRFLEQIKKEKPRFGKPYFKLEIKESELESLKQVLKKDF
ncbi:BfmA/BtgA family mobilization protein [Croceitalea sp. P059]|uniref:BfmA/BtgA family mobilization protein n=1 Tax=Croceitalea sp. P059 TaxID=3075601 RepID=UPI0028874BB7|nr:BfmA/BtgA family mobilization protein [Croceitalea sp. P059]MDT0540713.1 BfmA/BtgA family mobilization protein [Croceitalea sp. P059]